APAHQVGCQLRPPAIVIVPPAVFDRHVAAFDKPGLAQTFAECRHKGCTRFGRTRVKITDHRHPRLLRRRRERPCRRAAEERDEVAPIHSMTSLASARIVAGISIPSALAVVRLTTSSNLVGCSTGMSAGFAPRRTLSVKSAACRYMSGAFGP